MNSLCYHSIFIVLANLFLNIREKLSIDDIPLSVRDVTQIVSSTNDSSDIMFELPRHYRTVIVMGKLSLNIWEMLAIEDITLLVRDVTERISSPKDNCDIVFEQPLLS